MTINIQFELTIKGRQTQLLSQPLRALNVVAHMAGIVTMDQQIEATFHARREIFQIADQCAALLFINPAIIRHQSG